MLSTGASRLWNSTLLILPTNMLVAVWSWTTVIRAFIHLCPQNSQCQPKTKLPGKAQMERTLSLGPLVVNVRLGRNPKRKKLGASLRLIFHMKRYLCHHSSRNQPDKDCVKEPGSPHIMPTDFTSNSSKGPIKVKRKAKQTCVSTERKPRSKKVWSWYFQPFWSVIRIRM